MAKIGSFGKRRKVAVEDTVEFCGDELKLRPIDGYTLMLFTEVLSLPEGVDDNTRGAAVVRGMQNILKAAFVDEEFLKFEALCRENAVEMDELMEFAVAIFEWASARPTQPQSGPSGLHTIAGTNANDTFSTLAMELNGQATPESGETPTNTGSNA
jgi:hypothetical protein